MISYDKPIFQQLIDYIIMLLCPPAIWCLLLRVAGRTPAFSFKGKSDDLRTIGAKLNGTTVLDGSVRRAGNRVRITRSPLFLPSNPSRRHRFLEITTMWCCVSSHVNKIIIINVYQFIICTFASTVLPAAGAFGQ